VKKRLPAHAELVGYVRFEDRALPCLSSTVDLSEPFAFDKAVCAAGIKEFVRPRHPADTAPLRPEDAGPEYRYTWVKELAPGLRVKRFIRLAWPGQN
jgi:hypothetical protein